MRLKSVVTFCCEVEDESLSKTCASRQNRMADLAISIKHACIKGMPEIDENDAKMIAKAVLGLKGVNSKAQQEAQKAGRLRMQAKKFSYRITADPRTFMEQQEIWTCKPTVYDNKLEAKWLTLVDVFCPSCTTGFAVKSFEMRNRLGHFSKLFCKSCQCKTPSSLWCCKCGERWTKCRNSVAAP